MATVSGDGLRAAAEGDVQTASAVRKRRPAKAKHKRAERSASKGADGQAAGKLVNIDNGGTLTDICVIDGDAVYRTKTITTPHDLSRCLLDGLRKVSTQIYGQEDLQALLLSTQYIRYSTTQGTNALVERKGPRLGLIVGDDLTLDALRDVDQGDLLAALVDDRVERLDAGLEGDELEMAATRAVTRLGGDGANRIVIAFGGSGRSAREHEVKRMLLRKFPQHLLGAVPLLYSHEVVEDGNDVRRAWTALLNAFLHPAMERFLYRAEHKLREYRTRNPLLIFRNDGFAARVAKTIAIKTYSSGPRGGAEGVRALAAHYGFDALLSMDVGGTTTDIVAVRGGEVQIESRGRIQGIETSFALSDVASAGIGGSSIISVQDGQIRVGPESVGGAPGPACFGLGGTQATITDALLLHGLLDPATYFGGELKIDAQRARAAIAEHVATPLGLEPEAAVEAMITAWTDKVAGSLKAGGSISDDTVLAAFGGGGPMLACRIADAAGIKRIVIPGLAPVFSAFGIGFSDVAHEHDMPLAAPTAEAFAQAKEALLARAERGMFAEGADLTECRLQFTLRVSGQEDRPLDGDAAWPGDIPKNARTVLSLLAVKPITRGRLQGSFGGKRAAAKAAGERTEGGRTVPLYRIADSGKGARASGPAVLEDEFFTALVDEGWSFEVNEAGDTLLQKD